MPRQNTPASPSAENRGAASLRILIHWLETLAGVILLSQAARCILWKSLANRPFGDGDFARALPVSLRFDATAAGWLATPLIVLFLAALFLREDKARPLVRFAAGWRTFALLVCVWASIFDFGFFNEYRDQFDTRIFGAVDDDDVAVAKTFIAGYHWFRYLIAFAVTAAGILLFAKANPFARRLVPSARFRARLVAFGAIPVIAVLSVGCYRGGFGRRPAQLKDAYVCRDDAACRLVPNHLYLLRRAVAERLKATDAKAQPAFVTDIRKQAAVVFGADALAKTNRVSELLMRRNAAPAGVTAPRHVYLFVMESYDRWPMLPPYDAIGLTRGLQRLEAAGAGADIFVSGGSGTMPSLGAIITGLPPCDVPQNYQKLSRSPFATSVAPIFKKLGYRTRLAYGGLGGWQRIADFAREQGFDEVVTGSQVPCDDADRGEWGVPDGFLFRHLEHLADTDSGPTFTLIMSTSYHPPYSLDLKKYGCDDAVMPADLKPRHDGENSLRVFSHLKYADVELARMIEAVTAKHPDTLFGVTGDHWSRKFLNASPTLAERKCVPFVVYGPKYVPAGTRLAAGVHMDMVPTLLRFCAPEGFPYAAFGRDLFVTPDRPGALGNAAIVYPKGLYLADNPAVFSGEKPGDAEAVKGAEYTTAQKALSWWALMRGDDLPPAK